MVATYPVRVNHRYGGWLGPAVAGTVDPIRGYRYGALACFRSHHGRTNIDTPAAPPPHKPATRAAGDAIVLAMLVLVLVVGSTRFTGEWRFFRPTPLVSADGSAPVLQDDAADPAVDAAFRAAARAIPSDATCVIAQDSWNRDYFRASYLLMPRRVWPVSDRLSGALPSPRVIADAMQNRRASCLLIRSGQQAPAGLQRVDTGAYLLYVSTRSRLGP